MSQNPFSNIHAPIFEHELDMANPPTAAELDSLGTTSGRAPVFVKDSRGSRRSRPSETLAQRSYSYSSMNSNDTAWISKGVAWNANRTTSSVVPDVETSDREHDIAAAVEIVKTDPRLESRREKNRASQRAFRQRREKRAKHLETQLEQLHEKHEELLQSFSQKIGEAARLNARIAELTAELHDVHNSQVVVRDNTTAFAEMNAFRELATVEYASQMTMYHEQWPLITSDEVIAGNDFGYSLSRSLSW